MSNQRHRFNGTQCRRSKQNETKILLGSSSRSAGSTSWFQGSFPTVGLGASAGGLEASEKFLSRVLPDCGMAFVVVTHPHPGHLRLLPQLLGNSTRMPVRVAANGMAILFQDGLDHMKRLARAPGMIELATQAIPSPAKPVKGNCRPRKGSPA